MKKYTKILSILLLFLLFTVIAYATVTTANTRKSAKLPWQGTPTGYYDAAHNVGTSYVADARFNFDSGTSAGGTSVVKDNVTGLYWQSNGYASQNGASSDLMTWADAKTYCTNLTQGGYTDWRLPTFMELSSVIDLSRNAPSMNTSYFSSAFDKYWSSTIFASNTTKVWFVDFYAGYSDSIDKTTSHDVRCVR